MGRVKGGRVMETKREQIHQMNKKKVIIMKIPGIYLTNNMNYQRQLLPGVQVSKNERREARCQRRV